MSQPATVRTSNHERWFLGQKYFIEGICHSNHLRDGYARKAIHYYAWCGDASRGIVAMPGPENAEKRHAFYMAILDKCAPKMELPGFWRKIEEKGSWAAAHWVPDSKTRQQRPNRQRHHESVLRIEEAYNQYLAENGIAPSRNRLSVLANCRKDAASAFLKIRGVIAPGPRRTKPCETEGVDPASTICTDLKVSSLRTYIQEKKEQIETPGPAPKAPTARESTGPSAKKPLPVLPPKLFSPYEVAVHARGSCHLEKTKCRVCLNQISAKGSV